MTFQSAIVDIEKLITPEQKRFYSCMRFVADSCIPAAFYLHDEWSKVEAVSALGISLDNPSRMEVELLKELNFPTEFPKDGMPKIAYIHYNSWSQDRNLEKIPINIPNNELIISSSNLVNKWTLEAQGLNANTAILCLAAVGLDIVLPRVLFETISDDRIDIIKDKLQEERNDYINTITKIADEAYNRIESGDLSEIMDWARNEVHFKLLPKARSVDQNAKKLSGKIIKDAGLSFLEDGIPAIGAGLVQGNLIEASKIAGEEFLKLALVTLGSNIRRRNTPEISYVLKIAKAIDV